MIIDENLIEYLKTIKLGLEEFYVLYCKYYSNKWLLKYKPSLLVYNSLASKKLISDKNNNILKSGEKIILDYFKSEQKDLDLIEEFEEFWELFPNNDSYTYFPQTRILKRENTKDKCRIEYYTNWRDLNQVIKGLKYEIRMRSQNTQMQNKNNFTYMKSCENWLKQKEFLNWQPSNTIEDTFSKSIYDDIIE